MKTIQDTIEIGLNFEPFLPLEDLCFFDIETTGLNRDFHIIYLIGVLYYNQYEKNWTLIQLFADTPDEEGVILEKFIGISEKFKYLASYNGDSFDIPFVMKRMEKYGLSWDLTQSIDLYRHVRDNRNILELPDMKLKSVEKYLGIDRTDQLSGKECIGLYKSYVDHKRDDFLKPILQHNYDDLQHMPYLLRIMNHIEDKMTVRMNDYTPYISFRMETIDFIKDTINIQGKYSPVFDIPWKYYQSFYTFNLDEYNNFSLAFETTKVRLSENLLADVADLRILHTRLPCRDHSPYEIPPGLLVLKVDKRIFTDNLKELLTQVFSIHYLNLRQ